MSRTFAFLGTARSGLGHVRRLSSIARALRERAPEARIDLIVNAQPDGLTRADRGAFARILECAREEMATAVARGGYRVAVLDTLRLPETASLACSCVLVLRETPARLVDSFRRPGGKPWDRVLVPNPERHWMPAVDRGFAHSVEATGWIARRTGTRGSSEPRAGIVVATGGGGTAETREHLYPLLDTVIRGARERASAPFVVRQVLGPRSAGAALAEADGTFDPGGALHDVFRAADLVVSTAGYNSVLEIASTDTPALLAAIPRTLDDQAERVRRWGPLVGHGLDPDRPGAAAEWLAAQIERPQRRAPVHLGPDGAARAAALLLETTCPAS